MVPLTLEWSPRFKVGQEFGLDHLVCQTIFPALPAVKQVIEIDNYIYDEEKDQWNLSDGFTFIVEKGGFFIESPSKLPQIIVRLSLKELGETDEEMADFNHDACLCLCEYYHWTKE